MDVSKELVRVAKILVAKKTKVNNVQVTWMPTSKFAPTNKILGMVVDTLKKKGKARRLLDVTIDSGNSVVRRDIWTISGVAVDDNEQDGTSIKFVVEIRGDQPKLKQFEKTVPALSVEAESFVDEFERDTAVDILKEMGYELGDVDDFEDEGDYFKLEVGGEEWMGFGNSSDAKSYARERVEEDLSRNPENFNQDFILGEAADKAVRVDGVAYYLATYDGNQNEVDGTYWYRTN